jgi:hypothetical protein
MTGNLEVLLKNKFLLKSETKQHTKIKIITFMFLIAKSAKPYHINVCSAAFYANACTR